MIIIMITMIIMNFPSKKVSRSGKRYVKHVARVGSKDETARPPNVVSLSSSSSYNYHHVGNIIII